MTQALNLANFANNLNTSGATSNAGLQNSSVTVTAGTGMSGGGAVALGSSVTLTNAGVTSIVAGTGITVSGATGAVTVSASSSGGVTSVNGATGAVVTTGWGSIGVTQFLFPYQTSNLYGNAATLSGSVLYYATGASASAGNYTIFTQGNSGSNPNSTTYCSLTLNMANNSYRGNPGNTGYQPPSGTVATVSGTWRLVAPFTPAGSSYYNGCCGNNFTYSNYYMSLFVRVS